MAWSYNSSPEPTARPYKLGQSRDSLREYLAPVARSSPLVLEQGKYLASWCSGPAELQQGMGAQRNCAMATVMTHQLADRHHKHKTWSPRRKGGGLWELLWRLQEE